MSESPLSPERMVSVGVSAWSKMRSFVGRGAKISTPITMICGAIADLASTIGKFSFYLLIFSATVAVLSGAMWFLCYRRQFLKAAADGVMSAEEVGKLGEHNGWSVAFAFSVVAAVVMGGFVIAERSSGNEDKGVLASNVPSLERLQDSLFRVEKKVNAIQETATAVKQDTGKLVASVEEIARRFETLSGNAGLITGAKTPEEHYHNARVHELSGNFVAARKDYTEYLAANIEVLDPWLSYSAMLKAQEGRDGAIETLRYFGERLVPHTVSYATALCLLEEPAKRVAKLATLAETHPDYGPLAYLLSREYSEAKRGDQTLADLRKEKDGLQKFRAAHESGKFLKYFLDKKEAQQWLDLAEARWTKLQNMPANVWENPVSLIAMQSNAGWTLTFTLSDFKVKELFYRLDGQGEFVSTGHLVLQNPHTGLPMANLSVPLPDIVAGEHSIEVRYTDKNDESNGPYTLKFSTADQQLAQAKMMLNATVGSWLSFRDFDGKLLLYFTTLMTNRPVIQEIRYSLDNDSLDQTFRFEPTDKMFVAGDVTYVSVPKTTKVAHVQVTFKDGTKSAVQKFVRSQ